MVISQSRTLGAILCGLMALAPCGSVYAQSDNTDVISDHSFQKKKKNADFLHNFEKEICEIALLRDRADDVDGAAKKYVECRRDAILTLWDAVGYVGRDIVELEWAKKIAIADRFDKGLITLEQARVLIAEAQSDTQAAFRERELTETLIDAANAQARASQDMALSAQDQAFAARRQADAAEQQADAIRRRYENPPPITCTRWANTVTCQ